jgi:hypothetical protein
VNAAKLIQVSLNCGSSKLPKRSLATWKTGQIAIVSSQLTHSLTTFFSLVSWQFGIYRVRAHPLP